MHGLFIDNFCGGGGASTGIAAALGRDIDVAINHDPCAIAVHRANHPTTEHHCNDIRAVWPRIATKGRRVAGAWFSPDCKEFSKAKGGPVKDRSIRTLADEIPHWLRETEPEVAYVENVEEFEDWGPLEQGEDGKWRVILDRKGEDFKKWLRNCRAAGYRVAHRQLRACDYGAPTSRKRLYIVMRRDKAPIVWPKATHAPANDKRVLAGKLKPYRTAAECIDWSIECPSIFITKEEAKASGLRIKRPLEDATLHRVAHGVMRYVVDAAVPFIVPITHTQNAPRAHSGLDPLRTVTTTNGGEFMAADVTLAPHVTKFHSGSVGSPMPSPMPTVSANGESTRPGGATPLGMVGASLIKMGNGEREGQAPRALDPKKPMGATTASGSQAAIAVAHLEKFNADSRPKSATDPLDTAMASSAQHAVVETAIVPMIDRQFGNSLPADTQEPLGASTTVNKTAQVSAFLTRFHKSNTNGGSGQVPAPLGAVTAGGQHHGIVCAHMEQANTGCTGHDMRKPASTIVGKGSTQQVVETTMISEDSLPLEMLTRAQMVAAFLIKYYGAEVGQHQHLDDPMDVVTTRDRYAVVTVTIDAVTYVIVDIGLRMLTPRELARAQGFPDSYVLDPECWYTTAKGNQKFGRLPKNLQIRMIGNSVCPDVARALVRANQPEIANDEWQGTVSEWRLAA